MPLGLPVDPRTEQRDLTTTTGAGAIQTTVRTDLMTDALRGALVCARAGAQVLTDMDGAFSVPKQSAATTFEWVAEGGSPSGSNAVIGSQGYTPRTLTGFVDITRTFMKQTSLDAEAFARRDLTLGIAGALDAAALNGSGTGREPAGLRTLAGITTIALGTNGAAPTWDAIVALETAVANANIAIEQGAPAYVMTPKARGAMKTQLVNANAPGVFLWGLNVDGTRTVGTVNGYPAFATSYLPSTLTKGSGTGLSSMIFGDFSYLLMALWGGVDILVNPYAGNAGSVRLNIFQDADVAPRRAEAFARINDMVAA
jgi:HK97 family phage major capsid protein